MARISEKDAIRYGLIPASASPSTPARTRKTSAAPEPRARARTGRLRHGEESFDVAFFVPFEARTKHRPRFQMPSSQILAAFRNAKGNFGTFQKLLTSIGVRVYTLDDTREYENAVSTIAMAAMRGNRPHEGCVHVDLRFLFEGAEGELPTDVRDPDLDNVEKALLDALNGVVWKDDRLVCSKRATKECAPAPGIHVRVRSLASTIGVAQEERAGAHPA